MKYNNINIILIPEGEEERGIENLFEKVMMESLGWEDGGEVGGSGALFSLYPAGIPSQFSEEQSEQPMESQLI